MRAGASALPEADPAAPPTLADAAKVVAWALIFWGGEVVAASVFERNALAMAAAQAGLAEWAAGRLAIPWSDPGAPVPSWKAIGRRVQLGLGLGFGCALAVVVLAVVLRGASVRSGSFAAAGLVLGALVAGLGAIRDELLLRGVVIRATRLLPKQLTLLACALAAVAARLGIDGHPSLALLPEALKGAALGALWLLDRGAWMPCAANAAWTWSTGPAAQGDLLDVRFVQGHAEMVATSVVLVAAAAMAGARALGVRTSRRRGAA